MSNLVLTGPEVGPGEPPQASIWCNYTVQFRISNSNKVSLQGIGIQGCGVPNTYPSAIMNLDMFSAVLFDNVHSLEVENLLITQSYGYGLITYNCFKHILIRSCNFYGNYRRSSSSHTGGNALIYYDTASKGHTIIKVDNSSFFHGQQQPYQQRIEAQGSGGLNIFFMVTISTGVHHVFLVSVTNCSFVNNTGSFGGNMQVRHKSSNLIEVNFSIHCCSFINGTADRGGGLSIFTLRGGSFLIMNSTFTHNFATSSSSLSFEAYGGGVHIQMNVPNIVRIMSSRFSKNMADDGGGFYVTTTDTFQRMKCGGVKSNLTLYTEFELKNSEFDSNTAKHNGGHGHITLHVVTGNVCRHVIAYILSGCLFKRGRDMLSMEEQSECSVLYMAVTL